MDCRLQQKGALSGDILVYIFQIFYNVGRKGERSVEKVIRIAVCEDEQVLLEQLADQVKVILEKHSVPASVSAYASGAALLAKDPFDILLLDIEMEPLNGLELAGKLRARGDEGRVIFITAYQQYALKAYDVQAFHYLVKPVDLEKLETVLLKVCSILKRESGQSLAIHQGGAVRRIAFGQISYLEVINRKIYIHRNQETFPFYGKINELEQMLPEVFFRCHRSYIVNFDHVEHYNRQEIWLDCGEVLPLSKRRYQAFGLAFMHYLKKRGDVF